MWEIVSETTAGAYLAVHTYRMKVPGGWMVQSVTTNSTQTDGGGGIALLFIIDRGHEWSLDD